MFLGRLLRLGPEPAARATLETGERLDQTLLSFSLSLSHTDTDGEIHSVISIK